MGQRKALNFQHLHPAFFHPKGRVHQRLCVLALFALLSLGIPATPLVAAITPEQRNKLNQIEQMTREAGVSFAAEKFVESAAKIDQVQKELVELLTSRDPALQRLVQPIYKRVARARALLELEGAELSPLPTWDELTSEMSAEDAAGTSAISFQSDIAPWLISACGNCHINNRRGEFSLASFAELMKGPPEGTVIFAGQAAGSRIVEVIESGDMPRGGGKVTPEQLASLKNWIAAGAKFDGPDPGAALTSYASGNQPAVAPPMKVSLATGDETVSFATDIAPILLANCIGCHIGGGQASGNLRMDNFDQLVRGGDSGAVIASGQPQDSLLVKKLKGEVGQRMPAGGRPPLSAEQIELISTWIREGASFDGSAPTVNIQSVVNQAWAASASHSELFQRRQQQALANWKRVLPNDQPSTAVGDEVFVLGNVPPERIQNVVQQVNAALVIAKKALNAPPREPLLKGGLTVFVLKSRYDYSEFGRMTENRELPKVWLGHWRAEPLNVYGAMTGDPAISQEQTESLALQIVVGAALGAYDKVPLWFAEGVARNLVITNFRRQDERTQQWQAAIPAARQKVENAKLLIDGRLDDEAAGVVGMALTNMMMDRNNRRRFDKLLEMLREGASFDDALSYTYAPPEAFIKSWLGK